jgi:hypothetical protein
MFRDAKTDAITVCMVGFFEIVAVFTATAQWHSRAGSMSRPENQKLTCRAPSRHAGSGANLKLPFRVRSPFIARQPSAKPGTHTRIDLQM